MTPDDLIDTIIGALEACHGVRPATPLIGEPAVWWPRDTRKYAVDLHSAIVQIRIVATAMPLPPLLEQVAADIRPLLAGTPGKTPNCAWWSPNSTRSRSPAQRRGTSPRRAARAPRSRRRPTPPTNPQHLDRIRRNHDLFDR